MNCTRLMFLLFVISVSGGATQCMLKQLPLLTKGNLPLLTQNPTSKLPLLMCTSAKTFVGFCPINPEILRCNQYNLDFQIQQIKEIKEQLNVVASKASDIQAMGKGVPSTMPVDEYNTLLANLKKNCQVLGLRFGRLAHSVKSLQEIKRYTPIV